MISLRFVCGVVACATILGIAVAQTPPSSSVPAMPAILIQPKADVKAKAGGEDDGSPDAKAVARPKAGVAKGDADAKADEKPKEAPRLVKLRQLPHTRRPSAVLAAWSAPLLPPEPKPADKPESKDDKKPDPAEVALAAELAAFQRDVTLGQWNNVKKYLAGLPAEEGKAGYAQILRGLQSGGGPGEVMGGQPMMPQFREQNSFTADDIFGLAAAAPGGILKEQIASLASFLRPLFDRAELENDILTRCKAEASKHPADAALRPLQIAELLTLAGRATLTEPFLPTLDQAKTAKDAPALALLASHFLAINSRDKTTPALEKAWDATQAILTFEAPRSEQEAALRRLVELAPRLKAEIGQTWLDNSFTKEPARGAQILANLGALTSTGIGSQPQQPADRLKQLELQKLAVDALIKAAPAKATEWKPALSVLASAWLREAEHSQQYDRTSSYGPRMNRDRFGNIYFNPYDDDDDDQQRRMMMMQNQQRGLPQAINAAELLHARPGDDWLNHAEPTLKPALAAMLARLFLKVGEEEQAYPHIERLATDHPAKAKDLTNEFLRVWTKNHDPNASKRYTNPYMYMYGFESRAQSIPLTRSKQERNLIELAGWIARMKKLPCGEPDEELLAKAFTNCHSSAEVYRLEAIERVFGPVASLKPKTLASLAQKMRENLSGLWRAPAEQQQKGTNRKTKDIQAEVLRGYALAGEVLKRGLGQFPNEWSLHLAQACLAHDELNFQADIERSSDFAPRRIAALAAFSRAAELYASTVPALSEDDETTDVYDRWFYASLGAVDLGQIGDERIPDPKQFPLIRTALGNLPGPAAERHMGKFANGLYTRMSAVKPAVKQRYLKYGFVIAGDHKQSHEAKKLFDYYADLNREVQLEALVDGPTDVGSGKPFGVFVRLKHTRDIERESGGFGKYLQNQNSGRYFSYNYGRPTADYRDRFQAVATEALKEQFEVVSITFETDKVHSRALPEYGMRTTPYCYVLLKAKGPQVDKIPEMRLDLDFLDTSGYVVLPVETKPVAIACNSPKPPARPVKKLSITQILDERQAAAGKLLLEVKASGLGLVGDLSDTLELAPAGFTVANVQDNGVSVARYSEDADPPAVQSERTWIVTLQGRPGAALPPTFAFGSAKQAGAEMVYQRYQDADLTTATPEVPLEGDYRRRGPLWPWVAGGTLAAVALGLAVAFVAMRPTAKVVNDGGAVEAEPFAVIGLLRAARTAPGRTAEEMKEIDATVASIERYYFADRAEGPVPDLGVALRRWGGRV